jgi:hypothetical protein
MDTTEAQDWTAFVDPSEPRYCVCNEVSYGDMVACDNADVSCSDIMNWVVGHFESISLILRFSGVMMIRCWQDKSIFIIVIITISAQLSGSITDVLELHQLRKGNGIVLNVTHR